MERLAGRLVIFAALLIACRLTAGPPDPTATSPPRGPAATAVPSPTLPATGSSPRPSVTPLTLPSPTPLPTPLDQMPAELPAIVPENFSQLKPLIRINAGDSPPPFTGFSFSSDGTFLATIDCQQQIKVQEVASGQELPVKVDEEPAACEDGWQVAFSPDGRLLASTASATVRGEPWTIVHLWSVARFFGVGPVRSLAASPKSVTSLAFSPDGRTLAAGTRDNRVKLWFFKEEDDPSLVSELGELALADWVMDVAFSPDGRTLGAGTAEETEGRFTPAVKTWDMTPILARGSEHAGEARSFEARTGPLLEIAFSPDGSLLAAAGNGVTVWEAAAGEQITFLETPANNLAFSPDGRILVAGGAQLLLSWETAGNHNAETDWIALEGLTVEVEKLAFSPDGGALAILTSDGILELWGVEP